MTAEEQDLSYCTKEKDVLKCQNPKDFSMTCYHAKQASICSNSERTCVHSRIGSKCFDTETNEKNDGKMMDSDKEQKGMMKNEQNLACW